MDFPWVSYGFPIGFLQVPIGSYKGLKNSELRGRVRLLCRAGGAAGRLLCRAGGAAGWRLLCRAGGAAGLQCRAQY